MIPRKITKLTFISPLRVRIGNTYPSKPFHFCLPHFILCTLFFSVVLQIEHNLLVYMVQFPGNVWGLHSMCLRVTGIRMVFRSLLQFRLSQTEIANYQFCSLKLPYRDYFVWHFAFFFRPLLHMPHNRPSPSSCPPHFS